MTATHQFKPNVRFNDTCSECGRKESEHTLSNNDGLDEAIARLEERHIKPTHPDLAIVLKAAHLYAQSAQAVPQQWTQTPPTEQGWYWNWSGDPENEPLPTSVMFSGSTGKCFVTQGQLGLTRAVDCDQYGGYWLPISAPKHDLSKGE